MEGDPEVVFEEAVQAVFESLRSALESPEWSDTITQLRLAQADLGRAVAFAQSATATP